MPHTHTVVDGPSGVALWHSRKVSSSTIVTTLAAICRLRSPVYYFPCVPLIIQFLRRITWLNFHPKKRRRGADHQDRLAIDRTAIITIVNGSRCCGLRVAFVRLSDLWFNFIVNWNSTSLVSPRVSRMSLGSLLGAVTSLAYHRCSS